MNHKLALQHIVTCCNILQPQAAYRSNEIPFALYNLHSETPPIALAGIDPQLYFTQNRSKTLIFVFIRVEASVCKQYSDTSKQQATCVSIISQPFVFGSLTKSFSSSDIITEKIYGAKQKGLFTPVTH